MQHCCEKYSFMHQYFLPTQPIGNRMPGKKKQTCPGKRHNYMSSLYITTPMLYVLKQNPLNQLGNVQRQDESKGPLACLCVLALWKPSKFSFFGLEQFAMYVNVLLSFALMLFFSFGNPKAQIKYFILLHLCSKQLLSSFFSIGKQTHS